MELEQPPNQGPSPGICIVCFDDPNLTQSKSISCKQHTNPNPNPNPNPDTHTICLPCLQRYLTENYFLEPYRFKQRRCLVKCPRDKCGECYPPLLLYAALPSELGDRYARVCQEALAEDERMQGMQRQLQDILTIKCPSCKTANDPFPDACSAVLCLHCGMYYCNYCLQGFNEEDREQNSAAAHRHVAAHHPSLQPEERSAFLPATLIEQGHKMHREAMLATFVHNIAAQHGRGEAELVLLIGRSDVRDVGVDLSFGKSALDESPANVELGSYEEAKQTERTTTLPNAAILLFNALSSDNKPAVQQILTSADLNPHYIDPSGFSLAFLALVTGYQHVFMRLLDMGTDPLACNNRNGRNCLYLAVERGHYEIVDFIISTREVDVNRPATTEIYRYTPLHVAVLYGHGHIAHLLLDRGANIDAIEGEHGYTALHLALVKSEEWTACVLVKNGARLDIPTNKGTMPFAVAVEMGLLDAVRAMLETGLVTVSSATSVNTRTNALHVAAEFGQLAVLRMLLGLRTAAQAVNQIDINGATPLLRALINDFEAGAYELALYPQTDVTLAGGQGRAPLFVAVEKGMPAVVHCLVTVRGVDINSPVTSEPSMLRPIHVAILQRKPTIVRLLLELGAQTHYVDAEFSFTPLMMAINAADSATACLLLRRSMDNPTHTNIHGYTAMHMACEGGMTAVVSLLVKMHHVDVNVSCSTVGPPTPPLHVAAKYDKVCVIEELIRLGARVSPDALTIAHTHGALRAAHFLRSVLS